MFYIVSFIKVPMQIEQENLLRVLMGMTQWMKEAKRGSFHVFEEEISVYRKSLHNQQKKESSSNMPSTRPHKVQLTKNLLKDSGGKIASSSIFSFHYHLLRWLQNHLDGLKLTSNEEVEHKFVFFIKTARILQVWHL